MGIWQQLFKKKEAKPALPDLGTISVYGREYNLNEIAERVSANNVKAKPAIEIDFPKDFFDLDTENPWLILSVHPFYELAPVEWLSYIETIRRKNDWLKLGFPVKTRSNGSTTIKPIIVKGTHYGYRQVNFLSDLQKQAAITGKKLTDNKRGRRILIERGCPEQDFLLTENELTSEK